jgi:hypothetical protein
MGRTQEQTSTASTCHFTPGKDGRETPNVILADHSDADHADLHRHLASPA